MAAYDILLVPFLSIGVLGTEADVSYNSYSSWDVSVVCLCWVTNLILSPKWVLASSDILRF